jgi:hypothetical protein
MNALQIGDLYRRAIEMNAEAFAAEEYDIAYHALMVALHSAQSLADSECLREVERIATEQLRHIDLERPEYQHSTNSAHRRGHFSIFDTAARQARARVLILDRRRGKVD